MIELEHPMAHILQPGKVDAVFSDIYKPLPMTTDDEIAIRVVSILPGLSAEGRIRCQLKTIVISKIYDHDQAEGSRYTALSYLWGPEGHTKNVEINGQPIQVRRNLCNFLDYICQKQWFRSNFWIDALCIDPLDTLEKNHQVKSMGIIYNKASMVLIWLGKDLESFDRLFDIATAYHEQAPDGTDCEHVYPNLFLNLCREQAWCTRRNWVEDYDRLMRHDYWSRAWVQQEFELARFTFVLTSSRALPLDELTAAVVACGDYQRLCSAQVRKRFFKFRFRAGRNTKSFPKLYGHAPLATLQNNSKNKCSDLRDRVFSQVSTIFGGQNFQVDYDEDSFTLLIRTFLFSYEHGHEQRMSLRGWDQIRMALGVSEIRLLNELNMRAAQMGVHTKLLARLKEVSWFPDLSVSDWHDADPSCIICPHCESKITCSVRPSHFSQLGCIRIADRHSRRLHFSFPAIVDSDPYVRDAESFMYHYEGLHGVLRQKSPSRTLTGLCLTLYSCLSLLQEWLVHIEGPRENGKSRQTEERHSRRLISWHAYHYGHMF